MNWTDWIDREISTSDFAIRTVNALRTGGINTIRDLVQKTDRDLLAINTFGPKALHDVKAALGAMGLSLGMPLDHEPEPDITVTVTWMGTANSGWPWPLYQLNLTSPQIFVSVILPGRTMDQIREQYAAQEEREVTHRALP